MHAPVAVLGEHTCLWIQVLENLAFKGDCTGNGSCGQEGCFSEACRSVRCEQRPHFAISYDGKTWDGEFFCFDHMELLLVEMQTDAYKWFKANEVSPEA